LVVAAATTTTIITTTTTVIIFIIIRNKYYHSAISQKTLTAVNNEENGSVSVMQLLRGFLVFILGEYMQRKHCYGVNIKLRHLVNAYGVISLVRLIAAA